MQTQPTTKPARSPIPGIIPEPVSVPYDAVAAHRRVTVAPTMRGTTRPTRHRARSDPPGTLLARILSVMRSDKRRARRRRRSNEGGLDSVAETFSATATTARR